MKTTFRIAASGLALLLACRAHAQAGLQSAGSTTSLISHDFSAITLETKETSLSFVANSGVFGRPRERQSNFRITLSADDSKRALFADGRLVPGLEVEERLAFTLNQSDFGTTAEGYTAAYISGGYEMKDNALARSASGGIVENYNRTTHGLKTGLGLNWAPREIGPVFGVSATAGWTWGTPVARKRSQVCTRQATGTNASGGTVSVDRCENRFFGGVHDVRSADFRVDLLSPHVQLRFGHGSHEKVDTALARLNRALGLEHPTTDFDSLNAAIGKLDSARSDVADALAQVAAFRKAQVDSARTAAGSGTPEALQKLALAEVRLELAQQREREGRAAHAAVARLREQLFEATESENDAPAVSFLFSGSANTTHGDPPVYSVAAGPLLHPSFTPMKVVAAVLFELQDLTNATGEAPTFRDRFGIRLYIGVPF